MFPASVGFGLLIVCVCYPMTHISLLGATSLLAVCRAAFLGMGCLLLCSPLNKHPIPTVFSLTLLYKQAQD